jgi:hypothetical protein
MNQSTTWLKHCGCLTSSLVLLAIASLPIGAQTYRPRPITLNQELSDILTEKDIPTGQGGFARDYSVSLQAGDQIVIELNSDNFDAVVALLSADGSTVAENDDGPEGSSNSLLFTRITKTGNYIVRVRAFGENAIGNFTLKVTRLRPA